MDACVDVVIPTRNARQMILDCLARLDDPAIARLIVVDDSSDDGTTDAIAERFPEAEIVALNERLGLAHALNAGAARGKAPFVLFLNNDVFAEPGAVSRMVEALASRAEEVSAAGRLVDLESGLTQDGYRPHDFPTLATFAARLFGIERYWPANPLSGGHIRHPLPDDAVTTISQQPAGACMLVRREGFDRAGRWNEHYWFWYEDVDLSRRLADQGPALYVGPAVFRHVGRHSTRNWTKAEQHRRLYRGMLLYGNDHFSRFGQIALGAMTVAVCLPRIAFYGVFDRTVARIYLGLIVTARSLVTGRLPGD